MKIWGIPVVWGNSTFPSSGRIIKVLPYGWYRRMTDDEIDAMFAGEVDFTGRVVLLNNGKRYRIGAFNKETGEVQLHRIVDE